MLMPIKISAVKLMYTFGQPWLVRELSTPDWRVLSSSSVQGFMQPIVLVGRSRKFPFVLSHQGVVAQSRSQYGNKGIPPMA